ncbi:metallophosphoesterase family protein [Pararoseomonas indoligenes]|uniref:Metallophosphoesterase family protein n=1 Tax=Roseomonas indoligenes TaxID=2820811 RepID=A0A940N0Z5_9PROT|nr:metallophosphoesterase family protein [Pararoseomonas indoligenes]MBP0494071.1 metallophosphoesterase family protein [Pararoseomonas indoligenes]
MRIAAIADTHGNCLALEAVLDDIRAEAPDLVVNLGDLVSGPFDPAGAAEAQMTLGCPTVAGNHERQVLEGGGLSDTFARGCLSRAHRDWILGLPKTLSLLDGAVFACHGSPAGGDLDYLLEDVSSGRTVLAAAEAIAPKLAGIGDAGLVLCGHTHTARAVRVGGVLVVNPGSVGYPAYRDAEPVPHAMEAGSPHARYALLTRGAAGWAVDLRVVPYDWEGAARQAEANGRPDAAHAVRTGRVLPRLRT